MPWSPVTGMASRYSNTGAAEPTWRTVYTSRPTTSSVASPPQKTNATGSSARMARTTRSGGRSKASSSVRKPARRRPARAPARGATPRRAAGSSRTGARPAGGSRARPRAGRRAASRWPSGARARARRRGRRARRPARARGGGPPRRVRSTERTARLSSMIRSASVSSKWSNASSRRLGRARPLAALAGELDGGRDVVRLEQGAAQRLELREVVLAVTALGPARLRIAEAALPAAQRVGAHPQELCRCVGPDTAHVASVSGESQNCPAITSHVRATSWGVRAALHRFSVSEREQLEASLCPLVRCCATRAVVLAQERGHRAASSSGARTRSARR